MKRRFLFVLSIVFVLSLCACRKTAQPPLALRQEALNTGFSAVLDGVSYAGTLTVGEGGALNFAFSAPEALTGCTVSVFDDGGVTCRVNGLTQTYTPSQLPQDFAFRTAAQTLLSALNGEMQEREKSGGWVYRKNSAVLELDSAGHPEKLTLPGGSMLFEPER